MRSDELRSLLSAKPFVPFTVRLAAGRALHVTDPEYARVTPNDECFMAYTSQFDIVHLTAIVGVDVESAGQPNPVGA